MEIETSRVARTFLIRALPFERYKVILDAKKA